MAENKKSFIAYCDWLETFESMPDDKAGELIKHILRYVNDKNPETDDILIKAVFASIKQTLKRDLKKYESYIEKQRENGKKGGRPKNPTKPKKPKPFLKNPTKPKKADSVSDSVSDSESKKYIYNEFYDSEIKTSENNEKYIRFVKILFGDNEDNKKLFGILSMTEQLTFKQFIKCLEVAKKNDTRLSEHLLKIENDPKYYKGKVSLNRTLQNWLNSRFVKA